MSQTFTKQDVVDFIKKEFIDEDSVQDQLNEIIPDFLEDDWQDDFEDENEAYGERGRGEAEDQIRSEICERVLQNFYPEFRKDSSFEEQSNFFKLFNSEIGIELSDLVNEVFPNLDK